MLPPHFPFHVCTCMYTFWHCMSHTSLGFPTRSISSKSTPTWSALTKSTFTRSIKLFKIHVRCKSTRWTSHYLTPYWWMYWMWQRSPHRVIQHRWMYWVRETDCVCSKRKTTARLQCWCQREQERNRADRCKAYIDSYTVRSPLSHSVDPSAWS